MPKNSKSAATAEPPINASDRFLTPSEAAHLLNVSGVKIHRLMRAGIIRSIKVGGSRRIRMSALQSYVDSL